MPLFRDVSIRDPADGDPTYLEPFPPIRDTREVLALGPYNLPAGYRPVTFGNLIVYGQMVITYSILVNLPGFLEGLNSSGKIRAPGIVQAVIAGEQFRGRVHVVMNIGLLKKDSAPTSSCLPLTLHAPFTQFVFAVIERSGCQ